ncbi:divalent-cation tolerance protein CutA [Pontiella sulfatireligans]|uniref:Divalent-cation tolerance protein CutA n=1 Tax=Pontiella sulfatireligans TaxID=2750658 RepID=A0A6C2UNL8_9BACT|nr:divalent-cation tolerance protein CutA [Pontiella sulfatireligans]VGO20914.1 Divalent-cation tolerance protein CutA [Pontiella sulfatireligans]
MRDAFWVYVTAENEAEAKLIAKTVVEERLAACANLLGGIQSIYWWEGKVCEGEEVALVLKTSNARKTELIDRIKQLHSYDCPCIVCLPIADGNPGFLSWIAAETS